MLMSVFNKHRDIALSEKRAEEEKRKQEALRRLQKEKELEDAKPKLKELTDEEAEQLQKELDMVWNNIKYIFILFHLIFFFKIINSSILIINNIIKNFNYFK